MGRSTTQELITLGKAQNGYNNSGIDSDAQWVSHFGDALNDLVDDLSITKPLDIVYDGATRLITLPEDFYSLLLLNESNGNRVVGRRNYDQVYPAGYWILNNGDTYTIDLYKYDSAQTFKALYQRYATKLTLDAISTQKPEVPSVGEKALIYYAIGKALRNNNIPGQAQDYERLYEEERKKIRTAATRARAV